MLNQAVLDGLINAACSGKEIDKDKLVNLLGKISDKIFGVNEKKTDSADGLVLRPGDKIWGEAKGKRFVIMELDANGILQLGTQVYSDGTGAIAHRGSQAIAAAPFPAIAAGMYGVIMVGDTAGTLYFYTKTGRFTIAGVAF